MEQVSGKRMRGIAPWIALTALLVALASAGPARAANPIPSWAVDASPAEVTDYWTAKRMREARPATDLLAGVPALNSALDGLLGLDRRGTPRRATQMPDPTRAPFRTHGKVFLTLGGIDYVCSGTVVRAKTKRLVVTAGHCLYGQGMRATNWMFVPGKDGGSEPYGRWTARELATTPQWRASEDLRYDVGMATMRNRNGKRLQDVVGARGIAFNRGRKLFIRAFGYPAQGGFDGNHAYRCRSQAQGTDRATDPPRPTRIACDMTGGSSGGGWVIGKGRVNSVTSYGYETPCPLPPLVCVSNPEKGKLFGPYFGAQIKRLYRSQRR